jgi:hypothetical protein
MHRSRIGCVLIDHTGEQFDASLSFWAGVQRSRPTVQSQRVGVGEVGTLNFELRQVEVGAPRILIDIETDDIPAEVSRLEGLGASVVEERDQYIVMADPGGVVFGVTGVQTGDRFTEDALEWP